jgi:hypothetical protein
LIGHGHPFVLQYRLLTRVNAHGLHRFTLTNLFKSVRIREACEIKQSP